LRSSSCTQKYPCHQHATQLLQDRHEPRPLVAGVDMDLNPINISKTCCFQQVPCAYT
jgi:hypothetical protein